MHAALHASGIIPLLTGKKNLLYPGYYPGFDWQHDRSDYWKIYTYQYVATFITANLEVAIDLYYCFVIHTLSAQYNIVGHRIKSIQFDKTENSIAEVRSVLIDQIVTHQRLNQIFQQIQRNVQWAYFFQMILSSIVICSMTRELAGVSISIGLSNFHE